MSDEEEPKKEPREPLTVPSGETLQVAVSCLVKALRRGQELEALAWAETIAERYPHYAWRRLLIFCSEDVGIANPEAVTQVRALHDNWTTLYEYARKSKRGRVDRGPMTMAVMLLARSGKSREADDLLNAVAEMRSWGWMPPVPDEALDIHTDVGKARLDAKDRLRHWVEQASRVIPRTGPYDWRLWLLRCWGGSRGFYVPEFLDRLAAKWDREARLRYGVEGYEAARFDWRAVVPEIDGLEPYDGDEHAEEWL